MLSKLEGKIIEVIGNPDIGKTKFVLSLLDKEDLVLYIDIDRKLYNISNDNIFIYQENFVENILNTLKEIIEYVDVIIIDSLPTLMTKNMTMNNHIDKKLYSYIKEILSWCINNKKTLFIINQLRFFSIENDFYNSFGLDKFLEYYSLRVLVEKNKYSIVYHKAKRNYDFLSIL